MQLLFLAGDADPAAGRAAEALRDAGYVVRIVAGAPEAEHLLHAGGADALVVDADVLDEDTLLRLRRDRPTQPVIAWVARPSSDRSADLLDAGAHEVLSGGMGGRELAARVGAALRAVSSRSGDVVYGGLEIDGETGEATWEGTELRLTGRERQVLQVLAATAGRTVRRDRLYRQVWGYAMARGDRSVDVNVTRLRAKLGESAAGRLEITTQPGVGYRLELRDTDGAQARHVAAVTPL